MKYLKLLVLAMFIAFPSLLEASGLERWLSLSDKITDSVPWCRDAVESKGSVIEKPLWVCVKEDHVLFGLDEKNRTLFGAWTVAVGRIKGQKQRPGDMRTPEGVFQVQSLHDASSWPPYKDSETGDSIGYGPWFIRLKTAPWTGIGIHGTDEAHLGEIGSDASHGCIRMANSDLLSVMEQVKPGQKVIILP